jgi:TolA-binding protein
MNAELKPTPSFWSRLERAFVNILRFLLIIAVLAGVVAAIYYGTPYLYEKFILPVETNTARLSEVESKQATDVSQLNVHIADLKSRLADLETRQTTNSQAMAESQGRIAALETALQSHSETLKQLAAMQTSLDTLSATSTKHESLLVGGNSALTDLQRQVTMSRSIELLSRASLYLYESNFGLARQDVQAARELLVKLQSDTPVDKIANLQDVISRLDLVLGNLPSFPVIAANDVDIAWQLLVYDLPDLPTPTFTPEPDTNTPTPTAEVTTTITP